MITSPAALPAPLPTTVVDLLLKGLEGFGRRDQIIARHFIDHAEELPFLSALELAEALNVSGAAITRFSQRVGFEGYPHLQRVIRQELRATLGIKQPGQQDAVVASFWASQRANLDILETVSEQQLLEVARALVQARQVWVIGARSSYGLALTTEYLLSSFRPRVQAYSTDQLASRPEQLLEMNAEDAVLVFTVRRYSRSTTKVTTALQSRGVQVLLLTDQGASPLGKIAHHSIRIPTQGSEALASLAPILSLVSLIASLVARELDGGHLQEAEQLKEAFSIYEY
ncbi:MurR/RpiR family transcriptional regulator [Deinococcus sp. Arct2-2]|uniref:MurR/RpiR family transcriptional regulator n=1 Tax=Deinococcus sp. Arct2-2 TaxID=2568653 RepID=UPI0010A33AD6|nr:MurR/RpiR family transcriptional regulator [Deinococcus sp. Arct2-2]THF70202.1 MurR/RpiR family transcriptional regulator [Deinococcus sp. Arct2-2]